MAHSTLTAVRDRVDAGYFRTGSALNRVMLEAPYFARCSDNKTATKTRPREYAVQWPYMQVNRDSMASWLIFDLDHTNVSIWEDAGLPAPNLIVARREHGADGECDGKAHLYYAIEPVCKTVHGRARPIEYMRAIYLEMAVLLRADLDYHSGPVAKTPGHPWWRTTEIHSTVYPLGDLAKFVDLPSGRTGKRKAKNFDPTSRHCVLFEVMRHFAYSIVGESRTHGSYEHFVELLQAYGLNSMPRVLRDTGSGQGDLPWSSIKATARSIARWTWERYQGTGGVHRGVMRLDDALPLAERQRLAAKRTHEVRSVATESRIRAACRNLQAVGEPIVQAAVARIARLSRQTVAAYRHVVEEVRGTPNNVTPLRPPVPIGQAGSPAAREVNNAVHQVAAASFPPVRSTDLLVFLRGFPGPLPEPGP